MARRPKRRPGFLLSFRQVQCACGVVRISGVTCADCNINPAPHEADPNLQRRRVAALSAETLLRDGDPAIKPVKLEQKSLPIDGLLDLRYEILDWMDELWPALNSAAKDSAPLRKNVSHLLSIEQAFIDLPRVRPWINAFDVVAEMINEAKEMLRACLMAVSSPDPLTAQRHQVVMQSHLDRMGKKTHELNTWTGDLADALDLRDYPQAFPLLAEISTTRAPLPEGLEHWQEQENRGAKLYSMICGSSNTCPPGLGTHLMLLEASVGLLGDTKRFVRTAREIASIFLTDPVKAREIVTQTRWPTEMSQRMIEMYDAGRRSFLSTSSAQYDREVIAEFLTMGHTLVEVSSRPQVAALLAMARNKDYESIRSMGAGRVLSQLEDAGYQHLTKGLYRPIRNAWAHRSYRATETHVEFLEDSGAIKERMSYEELLDSLLAGQETVTALTAGLLCACSELGITLTSILPPADSFPLEPQIEMLGIYFSWRHIVLQQYADDGIEILAEVPTGPLSWPAIFAISSVLPDNFSRMRVTTRDGKLRGEIRLDLMREFVALEGMDQQLSYVRFQRNTVIDGTPLLNGEDLRFFVACCAVQASLEEGVVPAIRTLRKLRSLAQDEGDHELACALNGTIAVNRASWTGLEPSETESSHYRWLIDYAQRKPPSLLL